MPSARSGGSVTCSWSEERFERYIDGHVTGAERTRLLTHIDDCANCRSLLEELRVVDALLVTPARVELPPDFTDATMAEVQALPAPCAHRRPLLAWLVSSIAGGWLVIGAAFLIAPEHMRALGVLLLAAGTKLFAAFGGVGHVFGHLLSRGDVSWWTTIAGSVVIADLLALAGVIAALRYARPRIVERLRW